MARKITMNGHFRKSVAEVFEEFVMSKTAQGVSAAVAEAGEFVMKEIKMRLGQASLPALIRAAVRWVLIRPQRKKQIPGLGICFFGAAVRLRCPISSSALIRLRQLSTAAHAYAPLLLPQAARGNAAGLSPSVLIHHRLPKRSTPVRGASFWCR